MKSLACLAILAIFSVSYPAKAITDAEIEAWSQTLPESGAEFGKYPAKYQEIIKSYLEKYLKDPDSAKYSVFTKPRKEFAIDNALNKHAIYGYSACVLVNAKNSYGGYTGNHLFWFFIQNDNIIRAQDATENSLGQIISIHHPIDCQNC